MDKDSNKDSKNVYRDFTYMSDEFVCAIENMEDISELDNDFPDIDLEAMLSNAYMEIEKF